MVIQVVADMHEDIRDAQKWECQTCSFRNQWDQMNCSLCESIRDIPDDDENAGAPWECQVWYLLAGSLGTQFADSVSGTIVLHVLQHEGQSTDVRDLCKPQAINCTCQQRESAYA